MRESQEPKYDVRDGRIVNRRTGQPIPDDEPVFIFRAKDRRALTALTAYYAALVDPKHAKAVAARIESFKAFAAKHPERMCERDSG
ncbi:MAG: hypothetical protein M0038_19250 [Pseudomonadota bacterium]|jgi:hypothetical protein|nr:hypothetical protein [Pseudomonadota bacterium]